MPIVVRSRRAIAVFVLLCGTAAAAERGAAFGENITVAPSAESMYRQAQALLATRKSADLELSLDLFLQATRTDADHARAHAGAATAASLLALYSVSPPRPLFATARAEASTALRLEPQLAPARAAMGLIEYLDGWSFAAAETMLREALRLDPSYAPAWHWLGMMLMATQRFDESVAAFDRAIALEPQTSLYQAKRAGVLAVAGRTAEAERELHRAVDRFPQSGLAHRELGYVLIDGGRLDDGVASLRRAALLTGGEEENADLGWGLARAGRRSEAEAIAARLVAAAESEFVSPLDLASVFAGLGRLDDAFRWLDRAVEIHDPGLVYLATSPAFGPLRDDPRFATVLERVGLAPMASGGVGAVVEDERR